MTPEYRHYLSLGHLRSCHYAARKAAELESEPDSQEPLAPRHLALSSVMGSVAFLEANINELLHDAQTMKGFSVKAELATEQWEMIANLSALIDRRSVLDKHQILLRFVRGREVGRESLEWSNATTLVDFRNYLVHYKPHVIRASPEPPHLAVNPVSMQRKLRGKFALPEGVHHDDPSFPAHVLTASCAQWAVRSAVGFASTFYSILDPGSRAGKWINETGDA